MSLTADVQSTLFEVLRDISHEVPIRTTAFLILAKEPKSDVLDQLVDLIHTDPMDYMRIYITSYVESVLENDQPDLQR